MVVLLLCDLGVKDTVRNVKADVSRMEKPDADTFLSIINKYNIKKKDVVNEYPKWIIEKFRDSIWDILRDMMINITQAYTIWITNISEYNERRNAQTRAIANCESLLKEMELALDILPIDAEKYMEYVDIIIREIDLLKGWRKSDNKRLKELQK